MGRNGVSGGCGVMVVFLSSWPFHHLVFRPCLLRPMPVSTPHLGGLANQLPALCLALRHVHHLCGGMCTCQMHGRDVDSLRASWAAGKSLPQLYPMQARLSRPYFHNRPSYPLSNPFPVSKPRALTATMLMDFSRPNTWPMPRRESANTTGTP